MKLNKGLFTSNKQDYETDEKLIHCLKQVFKFDLDLCANRNNVCDNYFTIKDNCFIQDLRIYNLIYCNPPYNKSKEFINLLIDNKKNFVALLPARTDTKLFHLLNNDLYCSIIFLKGRLKFNTINSAPFPSMIVIYTYNSFLCIYYEFILCKILKDNNYL